MTHGRNWRIEDYITKHIQFFSVLANQAALGHHPGMFEKQRVDLLLYWLKNKALSGVKSNIMYQPQLYNDFNATANHLNYVVNLMPELQTAPFHQVSVMGRGGGRGRGCGRGHGTSRGGCGGRGGHGFDIVRGHGGRDNDRDGCGDRVSSSTTFSPETCPDQDAVDRVKLNIVHRHVTGDSIFVDDNTYRNLMDATERHSVFQRNLVSPHISPDLEHSMAISGVHQIAVRVVINKDPVASDRTVYNVWLHAANGVLVRAGLRAESG